MGQAFDITKENVRMRVASGAINDTRPLVAFLYALMLDEITPCRIERLASGIDTSVSEFRFLNGWRAGYAQDLADRLVPDHRLFDVTAVSVEAGQELGELLAGHVEALAPREPMTTTDERALRNGRRGAPAPRAQAPSPWTRP